MSVEMVVDARVLNARMAKAPHKVDKAIKQGINIAAIVVQRGMIKEAPVHDGELRRSVTVKHKKGEAKVYPKAKYAIFVEKGTGPHFPPIRKISKWAIDHGRDPFAVALHISKKGTKANPFVENTDKRYSGKAGKAGSKLIAKRLEKI